MFKILALQIYYLPLCQLYHVIIILTLLLKTPENRVRLFRAISIENRNRAEFPVTSKLITI